MIVFADTSAYLALLKADDDDHAAAAAIWAHLGRQRATIHSTNYVLLETLALCQRRFGLEAVQLFQQDISPLIHVSWIEEEVHQAGVTAVLAAGRRRLSLVDWISFLTARQLAVDAVFAFDEHFAEQGFKVLGPADA